MSYVNIADCISVLFITKCVYILSIKVLLVWTTRVGLVMTGIREAAMKVLNNSAVFLCILIFSKLKFLTVARMQSILRLVILSIIVP